MKKKPLYHARIIQYKPFIKKTFNKGGFICQGWMILELGNFHMCPPKRSIVPTPGSSLACLEARRLKDGQCSSSKLERF